MKKKPAAAELDEVMEIAAKATLLSLSFRLPGTTRKVNDNEVEVDANKQMLHISKRLFSSPEFDSIRKLDGHTARWLKTRALPSMFRKGVFLMPVKLIEDCEKRLRAIRDDRQVLVNTFLSAYPQRVEEAVGELRALYNAADYPSVEEMGNLFNMSWRYVTMDVPVALNGISKSMFMEEKQKAMKQWRDAIDGARKVLRESMYKLVQGMVDRMQPADDGKRKIIKEGSLDTLRDYLTVFDKRDITDDKELFEIVQQAKGLLRGVHVESIKSDDVLRGKLGVAFTQLANDMEGMVSLAPTRAISFSEE